MNVRQMVEKILGYYGKPIRVCTSTGERHVRGFVQPVTGKNRNLTAISVSPLGTEMTGQCVYIGPVEPELAAGDVLDLDGKQYVLRRIELIDGMRGPAYRWGICVEKGELDLWGMSGSET